MLEPLRALLDTAEQEPVEGGVVWSFYTRDSPLPLDDEDDLVTRIESGKGVFVIEMVFDAEFELTQRSSKKIKSAKDLLSLKRDRVDALGFSAAGLAPASSRTTPIAAPATNAPRRTTLLHGALLDVPSGDTPKKKR